MDTSVKTRVQEQIIAELGMEALAPEEQMTILHDLTIALLERVTTILVAKMPEDERVQIDALLEAGDSQALHEKIVTLVPDAAKIIDTVVSDGIVEYRELLAQQQ